MEEANILVPITMFGCIVVFLVLFAVLPPRRALLASFLGAWLFLPNAIYPYEGLPDYTKLFATCAGILLAVFIFDFKRLLAFRPNWVDIPMLIWCLVPLGSSITNFGFRVGFRDGLSEMLGQLILWGVPYFLGRIYFREWSELRELVKALIISGLIYVPFILIEMRFSPQLHRWVYGYHQHLFEQTARFGQWRPMVFMQHGLMVAFWMASISIISFWMWYTGTFKKISFSWLPFDIPFVLVAILFSVVTIFMVSVNAWVALALGIITLLASTYLRTRWILIALIIAVPLYALLQSLSVWPNDLSVDFVTGLLGGDRAQSLEFRYFNEEYLTSHALEKPVFGWAGWGRQHVEINDYGLRTVADSLWITFLGKFGAVGLLSLMLSILLPPIVFVARYPTWIWSHPTMAPAAAMAVVLVLYMLDGLLNNMINPLYMLSAGAMLGAYANLPAKSDVKETDLSPPRPQQSPRNATASY